MEGAQAPSQAEIEAFLEGKPRVVSLGYGQLLVDEGSYVAYRPLNVPATFLLHQHLLRQGRPIDDVILGPAVLLEGEAQWGNEHE